MELSERFTGFKGILRIKSLYFGRGDVDAVWSSYNDFFFVFPRVLF